MGSVQRVPAWASVSHANNVEMDSSKPCKFAVETRALLSLDKSKINKPLLKARPSLLATKKEPLSLRHFICRRAPRIGKLYRSIGVSIEIKQTAMINAERPRTTMIHLTHTLQQMMAMSAAWQAWLHFWDDCTHCLNPKDSSSMIRLRQIRHTVPSLHSVKSPTSTHYFCGHLIHQSYQSSLAFPFCHLKWRVSCPFVLLVFTSQHPSSKLHLNARSEWWWSQPDSPKSFGV